MGFFIGQNLCNLLNKLHYLINPIELFTTELSFVWHTYLYHELACLLLVHSFKNISNILRTTL